MPIRYTIFSIAFCSQLLAVVIGVNCFGCLPFDRPSRSGPPIESSDGRVWAGTCGNPSMQWKELIAVQLQYKELHGLEQPLSELGVAFPDRPFPWIAHRMVGYLEALTIIRAKIDRRETDIVIISADTCTRMNRDYRISSRISRGANAVADFGLYNLYSSRINANKQSIVACSVYPAYKNIINPVLSNNPKTNNFGIAKLNNSVPFSDNVKPVCLPASNETVPIGTTVIISGWDGASGVMKIYQYVVVEWSMCQVNFDIHNDERQFCIDAYHNETGYRLPLGSPVFTEKDNTYTLLGILGLNTVLVPHRFPAFVISLAHGPYQDWLEETIKKESALWE